MSQEFSSSFEEVPGNTKHNKILYEGHQLFFDRTTSAGKKSFGDVKDMDAR